VIRKNLLLVALLAAVIAASMPAPSAGAYTSTNGLLAFRTDRGGRGEIYTMDASGGSLTNLTVARASRTWIPPGRRTGR